MPFALFVDVMGVQQALVHARPNSRDARMRAEMCRDQLGRFHNDLADVMRERESISDGVGKERVPSFAAEFSDSAYIVDGSFATVATAGIHLMRRALRHEYPLRGGIGAGTFWHESSGVRTGRLQSIWSTSSFLGGAIVTAYQAERFEAAGMRVFVHRAVMLRNTEAFINCFTTALQGHEAGELVGHELRIFRADEVRGAQERLEGFRKKQSLSPRAERHYGPMSEAYSRFEMDGRELPFIRPAE